MPSIAIGTPNRPPYSIDGSINPVTAAVSIIPAAKEIIILPNLSDIFLNKKPIKAPMTVAPPTPSAVNITTYIKNSK